MHYSSAICPSVTFQLAVSLDTLSFCIKKLLILFFPVEKTLFCEGLTNEGEEEEWWKWSKEQPPHTERWRWGEKHVFFHLYSCRLKKMKGEKQSEGSESSEQRGGAGEMNSSHFRQKWFICSIVGLVNYYWPCQWHNSKDGKNAWSFHHFAPDRYLKNYLMVLLWTNLSPPRKLGQCQTKDVNNV